MSGTDARKERAGTVGGRTSASGTPVPGGPPPAAGAAPGTTAAGGSRPHRGRWVAAGVVVAAAAGMGTALATGVLGGSAPDGSGTGSSGYRTGTAAVTRQTLTSQTQMNATLGDAGSWSVVVPPGSGSSPSSSAGTGPGSGTFTWLPAVGRVIRQGQAIYDVSGGPVVLLYGDVPAYRDLSEGMTGADVRELNTDLVRLGYATRAALGPRSGWDCFSPETAYALERLQAKLGLTVTGRCQRARRCSCPAPR